MVKYKYEITYFDPADEEGRREKTWKFRTLKGARAQQEDLSIVWETPKKEIHIRTINKVAHKVGRLHIKSVKKLKNI
jgi:hypothetical protein